MIKILVASAALGLSAPVAASATPAQAPAQAEVASVQFASGDQARGYVLDWSDGSRTMNPSYGVARAECLSFATLAERNACARAVYAEYAWLAAQVRVHPRYIDRSRSGLQCPSEDSCPIDYRNGGWYVNGIRVTG